MQINDLITILTRQLNSMQASAFYINGSRGSGKSTLMGKLAKEMPLSSNWFLALGPYNVKAIDDFNRQALTELAKMGYVDNVWPGDIDIDLHSTWDWIRRNIKIGKYQNFIILLDLNFTEINDYENMRIWFSGIRYIQHFWELERPKLIFVVSGSWDHKGLEEYYRSIQLSFPYTEGINYLAWYGISLDETLETVKQRFSDTRLVKSLGSVVHEVTGGHPGTMKDILSFLGSGKLTLGDIFRAAEIASNDGQYARILIKTWSTLPSDAKEFIKQIILVSSLPKSVNPLTLGILIDSGIVINQEILGKGHIKIRSWFVELLMRNNAEVLGFNGKDWQKIRFAEFIPAITTLNLEAYGIINNVENLVRNFAVARLFEQDIEDNHILQNRVYKKKKSFPENKDDDAYERAFDWKERSIDSGIGFDVNPLIAYISTSDLAELIKEISLDSDVLWAEIIESIEYINPIRDAVMHNQIIDENSLENLYNLQEKIISALNR